MANEWYYYDDALVKKGPYTAAQLKQLAAEGTILPTTRIVTGDGKNSLARNVKGLFPENRPVL